MKIKMLSEYPMLIGKLIETYEARRAGDEERTASRQWWGTAAGIGTAALLALVWVLGLGAWAYAFLLNR